MFSVYLYPRASDKPVAMEIDLVDDTVPPSGDGRYELFKELDEQIRDGVKDLIHRGTTIAYHAPFEKGGAYMHIVVGWCVGLNNYR